MNHQLETGSITSFTMLCHSNLQGIFGKSCNHPSGGSWLNFKPATPSKKKTQLLSREVANKSSGNVLVFVTEGCTKTWFITTVDGWNPAITSWGKGSLSHYLQGFIHPRWCRISHYTSYPPNKLTHISPQEKRKIIDSNVPTGKGYATPLQTHIRKSPFSTGNTS